MTEIYQDDLLVRLKKGDPSAYDLIYDRYWKKLFTIAYRRTDDEETAKDLVQTVYISVWQNRSNLSIRTHIENFLVGAVKLQVLKHFRSESIKQKVLEYGMERMNAAVSHIHEMFPYYELEAILEQEVSQLPENMKQAYLLRNDNYSIKEIATILNIAEQTVSNNLSEALKRIRKRVASHYPQNYLSTLMVILSVLNKH